MKYSDMHCDTLTVCADSGLKLAACGLQTSLEKLNKSGCAAQCFAIFTQGDSAWERDGGAEIADGGAGADETLKKVEKYLAFFAQSIKENCSSAVQITCRADFLQCLRGGKTGCILTFENLGFIGRDLQKLELLKKSGAKMASLVWNYKNALAYPNLIFENGYPQFEKREERGLTDLGREAVERLDGMKIIVDISHLSDGGAEDILRGRKKPIVASHSNACAVCNVSRNLSDPLIKKIAACGGVIGVNFCKDFLGSGDTPACVLSHVKHIIDVGGEDVIALGSDFDGIPAPPDFKDCTRMPDLFEYLENAGLRAGAIEKIAYKNFLRVFSEICG